MFLNIGGFCDFNFKKKFLLQKLELGNAARIVCGIVCFGHIIQNN